MRETDDTGDVRQADTGVIQADTGVRQADAGVKQMIQV